MRYRVVVQSSEYHEKSYVVEADNEKDAEIKAVAAAEKEVYEDNEPVNWKYLCEEMEVFAPITKDDNA